MPFITTNIRLIRRQLGSPVASIAGRVLVLSVIFCIGALFSTNQAHSETEDNALAILGLEVVGKADKRSTNDASRLSEAIREVAEKSKDYKLQQDANKDVLEMKLLTGCTSESTQCMAKIAKQLNANFLLYGKLESNRSGHYTVRLLSLIHI